MSGKIEQMIGIVVAIVVASILLAYVLPVGLDAMFEENITEGWGEAESTLFGIIPIFLILVPLLVIIGWAIWSFKGR